MSDLTGAALELVEAGGSMQEADFYDLAMTGDGEPAMLPVDESPWLPIYREAARWIPSDASVTDLGCGTGRFAALLLGATSFQGYFVGIDFSPAAIVEAERYVGQPERAMFRVEDLRSYHPLKVVDREVFVCLEVLEHLDDDLGLLHRIWPGAQVIFSVPSYMSASHVRSFPRLADVFQRFGSLLELRRWSLVDFGNGNVVHVCDSMRRHGTW